MFYFMASAGAVPLVSCSLSLTYKLLECPHALLPLHFATLHLCITLRLTPPHFTLTPMHADNYGELVWPMTDQNKAYIFFFALVCFLGQFFVMALLIGSFEDQGLWLG